VNQQAQNLYLTTQIKTASSGELTLLLYNGCLKFMRQALDSIHRKDYSAKNENLKRSQEIIDELMITLNMNYEISHNLYALYQFIKENLIKSNMKMDVESLEYCIKMVQELRDTWAEALKSLKSGVKVGV
jgi:flagellar secretion chaperone FliS